MSGSCPEPYCQHCGFRNKLLTCLTSDELSSLALHKKMERFPKGATVVRQGGTTNTMLFIRQGLVKILRQMGSQGQQQIIGISTQRDVFGLINVFAAETSSYSVEALEPTEICMVDLAAVKGLIRTNGDFAFRFVELQSRVMAGILAMRLDLNRLQLRGRVAYVLCYFAQTVYFSQRYNLPITRREMADLIGMRVENVVRILSEMRREKVISMEGSTIEILNRDTIRRYKLNG